MSEDDNFAYGLDEVEVLTEVYQKLGQLPFDAQFRILHWLWSRIKYDEKKVIAEKTTKAMTSEISQ